ncbi:hypothetical protein [Psychroserpens sp.]|uniref:hypothetical protein n=1 Tax=Psychroserpens sp. TaxID=2020870 RepID=UPI001B13237A|nr:hypothetical protein [Psychroserpens sp.]MBO6607507.1 hypothetical protein [Psychroserpens sp.]MBO6654415.1 hypothetical protein [Psychroserpens sp.]MBO6681236.1 hypothetical protein [Psychroserpens sp.]MBO6749807.1 hypothetical protein [Psychroserpens sp.]MBO6916205.1 hypothetical protein [Psychroserpens sp.]
MLYKNAKYIEWLSADELHAASQEWLSELKFALDEHRFFDDLITEYTRLLIKEEQFPSSKILIEELDASKKQNILLIEAVQTHENELKIMLDGIDELKKEDAYTKDHYELSLLIREFLSAFKSLKQNTFSVIIELKKQDKHNRFIDKK